MVISKDHHLIGTKLPFKAEFGCCVKDIVDNGRCALFFGIFKRTRYIEKRDKFTRIDSTIGECFDDVVNSFS